MGRHNVERAGNRWAGVGQEVHNKIGQWKINSVASHVLRTMAASLLWNVQRSYLTAPLYLVARTVIGQHEGKTSIRQGFGEGVRDLLVGLLTYKAFVSQYKIFKVLAPLVHITLLVETIKYDERVSRSLFTGRFGDLKSAIKCSDSSYHDAPVAVQCNELKEYPPSSNKEGENLSELQKVSNDEDAEFLTEQ